jgi:hypothetical protein
MSNLLKITTKPIKISVQVEKGKYVKVEPKNQVQKIKNPTINTKKVQFNVNHSKRINATSVLPKNIKLNEVKNNINTVIQEKMIDETSQNMTFLPQTSQSAKIQPMIKPEMKYEPSNLDFVVSQYSEIKFEYVGDPIYIPESANPNKEK